MKHYLNFIRVTASMILLVTAQYTLAQPAMQNVNSRATTSLNGTWNVIIDPTDVGEWRQVWMEKKPNKKTDFIEYSFEGGRQLQVPGDFNTQMQELTYFEGTVWYQRSFEYHLKADKRLFIYFGAVNYWANVYLNGKYLGSHEGGFSPFQFEISEQVQEGTNTVVVKANNERTKDGIPATGFDWFNYGGITRDVLLIETNRMFINDYFIQLKKGSHNEVDGWVKLVGQREAQNLKVEIPELNLHYNTRTDSAGVAPINFRSKFALWSPEHPKMYEVIITVGNERIVDRIGFRNIEVKGTHVLLNGQPIFFKGVNIHEEAPFGGGKVYAKEQAKILLGWAKEVECNLVRLAHYPHNEQMVKLAEEMGLMVWDELPVYQHIDFASKDVPAKIERMMEEMISRDRNRCAVVIWSLSNETYPSTHGRNEVLKELVDKCRAADNTRLITSVANTQSYENHTLNVWDPVYENVDLVSVNEYLGWYVPWQSSASQTLWKIAEEKPVIISEFGGEAKFGNHGSPDEAAFWNEEYQEQIYKDQIEMFKTTPNLTGVCAWLLVDYRSPGRMHPVYQGGYNRKGLMSEYGEKKKAWYTLNDFYHR
jgi:beta-glucuronidase